MRIIISGSGIAGPTLAHFLTKCPNTHITIVEKAHMLLPHGQNIDLKGSAISVIRKMNLLKAVRNANTTERGTRFVDEDDNPFATFPVSAGNPASLSSEFEILRGDLADILYENVKESPSVEYVFGTTIIDVLRNDESSVTVKLSNGSVRIFDLLVVADGQWSKVRKQCFLPNEIEAVHMRMYGVYFTVPRETGDDEWWDIYLALGSRTISTRPDPHGTMRALFTMMPRTVAEEAAWRDASRSDRQTQEALLKRNFVDAGWQAQRLLSAVETAPDFYFHVIEQIQMSRWSHNRVVCLGDTAYAPTPLTGMGTSLAITGAYVLAGELSMLEGEGHPRTALEAYEKSFRPFVEKSQKIPPFVPDILHPGTSWRRFLIKVFVRVLAIVLTQSWIVKMLGDPTDEDDFQLPDYAAFNVHTASRLI